MTIDYSEDGKVYFTMFDYIMNMLVDLPADMDGEAATPATAHLFQVNEKDPEKLNEDLAQLYHHNVPKLLFLSRRARPDIQTSVAFLCTRVKAPDTDDDKKLARCMKYLRQSAALPLILEAEVSNIIKCYSPDIRYIKGENNIVANALSRLELSDEPMEEASSQMNFVQNCMLMAQKPCKQTTML
jgi:hypothetical protein